MTAVPAFTLEMRYAEVGLVQAPCTHVMIARSHAVSNISGIQDSHRRASIRPFRGAARVINNIA